MKGCLGAVPVKPWFSVYAGAYRREFEMATELSGLPKSEVFRQAMTAWIDARPGLRVKINKALKISSKEWRRIRRQREAAAKAKAV